MNAKVAAAIYTAVTCVVGRHVIASLASSIASDPGDPLLNAAILAWNATQTPWSEAWYQFPIFHPVRDALTLSENLLGLSVIATPLYWTTGSAAAAYNVTLLLTYPLSGMAMYALVLHLTRSSPAAFVAGLAFAFAPYRTSQLPHLQMLAVFWAPLALLALHRFAESGGHRSTAAAPVDAASPRGHAEEPGERWRWLALFAVCWVMQGTANGYMLAYFSLFVAGWACWFLVARRRLSDAAWVAAAGAAATIPLLPILYRYVTVQRGLGLERNLGEISGYSADIAAVVCAPATLTFWTWLRVNCAPEGELFPGVAFVLLGLALLASGRGRVAPGTASQTAPQTPDVLAARGRGPAIRRRIRTIAAGLAMLFIAIAVSVWVFGAWRLEVGPLRASASSPDKPMSTALALLFIAFLASDGLRAIVARGSTTTFYAGAAVVCWVLTWGPFPRLFGTTVLYQAPYAWLLQLPAVDALRVPARFWMLTVLCLSVCAGVVLPRLLRGRSRRGTAAFVGVAAAAVLVDGWTSIAAVPIPPPPAAAASLRGAPVLVAPVGDLFGDAAVVYHAVTGGWIAINGYSGYEPPHYEALRTLSQAGDPAQFTPFLRRGELIVAEAGAARRLPALSAIAPPSPSPGGRQTALRIADTSCNANESAAAIDGNVETRWLCGTQTVDHHVTLALAERTAIQAIVYALGTAGAGFPRHLVVETSIDGAAWEPAWEGSLAGAVLEAALESPRETRVVIRFAQRDATHVRLRQTGRHDTSYWTMAEIEVWGP